MSGIVDRLVGLPPWLVALVAFLLPAAEASIFVGVIFPGEIAIVIAGVLAHAHRLPLWLVILVGTTGAVLGDSAGYEIGARYGDRLLARLPRRLVKPEHLEQGRELLRRRGGWAVFIGRFAAALRALVPGLAGTSRLPYRVFLPFNFIGGLAWVTMSALIGYVAGASYKAAEHRLSLISGGLLALVVLALAYRLVRRSQRVLAWVDRYGSRLPGLAVTSSVAALLGGGWLLGGLTQDVVNGTGVVGSDARLLHDVVDQRRSWLTPLARGVGVLGSWSVVYGVLVLLAAVVIWRRRSWAVAASAVALLGAGQGTQVAISHAVAGSRPPHDLWLTDVSGSAFPAGQATVATIGFGLAALLVLRLLPTARSVTIGAGLGVTLLVAATGLSQLYLGTVWPSGVAGGWALGVTWLALAGTVAALTRLVRRRRSQPLPQPRPAPDVAPADPTRPATGARAEPEPPADAQPMTNAQPAAAATAGDGSRGSELL